MEKHLTFGGWGSQIKMPPASYMMEVLCICDNREFPYSLFICCCLGWQPTFPIKIHLKKKKKEAVEKNVGNNIFPFLLVLLLPIFLLTILRFVGRWFNQSSGLFLSLCLDFHLVPLRLWLSSHCSVFILEPSHPQSRILLSQIFYKVFWSCFY